MKKIWPILTITYSMGQSPSWEANWFAASQENSPHFTEPEGSLPHSQASATCLYPGPAQSSPYTHIHLLEIHPNIIHPSTPRSPQWFLPSGFPSKTLYTSLSSPIRAILTITWRKYLDEIIRISKYLNFSDRGFNLTGIFYPNSSVSRTRTHPKPHCICYLQQRLTSVLFLCTVTLNITEVCNNSALKWNRHITHNGLFCVTVVHMKGVKGGWKLKDVIRAIILTHGTDIDITLH